MAEKFKDEKPKTRRGEDDARSGLKKNWAQMTASMVSPGNARGSPVRKRRANGNGPAPLPISALPVPDEEPNSGQPPESLTLSTNERGELTPAQRARLGLDLEPLSESSAAQSAANAPKAPPAEQPLQPPSQRPAPRAQPQNTAAPAAEAPAAEPRAEAQAAHVQPPESTFDFRTMDSEPDYTEAQPGEQQAAAEPVRLRPVDDGPRLKPVSNGGPRLAPVRQPTAPADRSDRARTPAAVRVQQRGEAVGRSGQNDEFEEIKRDRNVLSYGVAWSAFAIVITGAIAFTNSMSGDPAAAVGPGPLIPGLLSIAIGWVIVIAARGMGNGWWSLMVIPAIVLLVGPYVYTNYWADSVDKAARSYLSNGGANVQIDVDATSVISETVNTDRGCFAINRTRKNLDTEVEVTTYQAETTRQQADYALAPRYAGRIETGGERSMYRVFTFKGGRTPAIITTPTVAPLDCANSTVAPGTGAKRDTGE